MLTLICVAERSLNLLGLSESVLPRRLMIEAMKGERVELGGYLWVKIEKNEQRIITNLFKPPSVDDACAVPPIVSWWVRDRKPVDITSVTCIERSCER